MKIVSDDGVWAAVVDEEHGPYSTPCIGCGTKPSGIDVMLQPMRSAFSICPTCIETLADLKGRAEEGMY